MTAAHGGDDRAALDAAGDTRRPRFLAFARRYARRRIARGLDGLWVCGLPEVRAALAGRPLILAGNHVAWWDALLLLLIDEALGGTGWALMDSRNLRGLPFLGWVGALPLDRSTHQRSHDCLTAAAAILDRPGRALWIFPQGHQRPAHLRPLNLKHGVQTLHDVRPVDVVVVSVNYVFLEKNRPAALVRFSAPLTADRLAGPDMLPPIEEEMIEGLAVIDAAAVAATDGGRARTHPRDPLPGFTALVAPAGRAVQDGLGSRLLRILDRRRRRDR